MASSKIKVLIATVTLLLVAAAAVWFVIWLRNPQRVATAKGERLIAKGLAEPFDMTGYYQTPADYFDQITQFPAWKAVPRGPQTFDGVPLDIGGMICLWSQTGAKRNLNFAEELTGIQIGRKFQTLYVYHTSFFASPNGTPVYEIVFRYEDGSSLTNQIRYGNDLYDWYARGKASKPTDSRSKLAWSGVADLGAKKQLLQFFLTAVGNPFPATTVTSIDLYSSKNTTTGCIHAMTTGRAGLMK